MFRKTLLAVSVGLVFSMSGCGGGGSDDDPTPQTIVTGTGYYVDSAVSGVKTKCGAKEGTTDVDGKFIFEVGKGCTFFLGDIKLRDIDKAILKDGVTVYETDKYTAQVLQSLDSDGNPSNGITISDEFVTALATANITTLPTNEAETATMLAVIETAGGTIVTETDAQSHAYSTLISGKDLYTVDVEGDNSQNLGPITFNADKTVTGDGESGDAWRFDGDKLYIGTGSAYHQVMSRTADYILFKNFDEDGGTTRAYFDRAKAEAFMATLSAPNNPPEQTELEALLAGKTLYKPEEKDGESFISIFNFNSQMSSFEAKKDEAGSSPVIFAITDVTDNSFSFSNGRKYTKTSKTNDYVVMMSSKNGVDNEEFRFYYEKSKAEAYLATLSAQPTEFTTALLAGKTFYIVNKNSSNGSSQPETCILEQSYTSTTYTKKEWVYHSASNWTSGCNEDFGDASAPYLITSDGKIELQRSEKWWFKLDSIKSDYYEVTDPDGASNWFFTKAKANEVAGS